MPQKSVNTRTREVQSKADAHCKVSGWHAPSAFCVQKVGVLYIGQSSCATRFDTVKFVLKCYANVRLQSHNELPPTKTNVGSKEFSSNEINGSRESNKRRREERLNSKLQVSHTTISV